jgi:D-aminoacyl-tRNA deacylase
MRAVVQRVARASVAVNGQTVSEIGPGLLVLLGVEKGDTGADLNYMADKVANLRIFEDGQGKMNRSVLDTGGQILVVSQFTLLGDARHGRRPGFTGAEEPAIADRMYTEAAELWRGMGIPVGTGVFRADMAVSLVNDGPVTILLDSRKLF